MAITSLTYTQIGPTMYRFSYESDLEDPIFYIYVDGNLVTETRETTYDVAVPSDWQIQFEVFDDEDDVPDEHFPGSITLRWDGTPDATSFRVDKYIGSQWVAQQVVLSDESRVFHYDSEFLEDSTTHQYRVVPIDGAQRDGTALEFEVEMCRYPDTPSQSMSIDSGEIVVA